MSTPGFLLFFLIGVNYWLYIFATDCSEWLKAQILRYMRLYEAVQSRREKRS